VPRSRIPIVAWGGKSASRCARLAASPRSLDDYGWSCAGTVELAQIAPLAAHWSGQSFLELGALPSAVPCARLHARQVLWEWGLTAFSENSELAVSELVTNAMQVSRATPHYAPVRIWVVSDRVQVVTWSGTSARFRRYSPILATTQRPAAGYLSPRPSVRNGMGLPTLAGRKGRLGANPSGVRRRHAHDAEVRALAASPDR
jgi:anti-sigma regulatory factor (Ser/Thr protein kinase)